MSNAYDTSEVLSGGFYISLAQFFLHLLKAVSAKETEVDSEKTEHRAAWSYSPVVTFIFCFISSVFDDKTPARSVLRQ